MNIIYLLLIAFVIWTSLISLNVLLVLSGWSLAAVGWLMVLETVAAGGLLWWLNE